MKTSCIAHPYEPLIIIRKSQVEFCDGNACAAALMSFFEYWHNIKVEMAPKNAFMNDIAEEHGEPRCHDTSLYQFHNMTELSNGIIGLYGISSIKTARKLLVEKKIISEHKNPSGRYGFDHTIYYLFHPETYSKWLNGRIVKNNESISAKSDYPIIKSSEYDSKPLNDRIVKNNESVNTESLKVTNREVKNNDTSVKNNHSSVEINGTITEITYKTSSENVVVGASAEKIPEFTISTQGVLGVDDAIETNKALKRWLEYFMNGKGYAQCEAQTVDTVPMFLEWVKEGVTDDDMVFAELAVTKSLRGKKPTTPLYYRQIVKDIVQKRKSQDTAGNGPGSHSTTQNTNQGGNYGTKRHNNETNSFTGGKPTAAELHEQSVRGVYAKQQREGFANAIPVN
jgi:hypothetical protein